LYDCMIVLRSTSAAQRAVRGLSENGIPAIPVRPPAALTGSPCAHGIKFDRRFLPTVQSLLSHWQLDPRGVYDSYKG